MAYKRNVSSIKRPLTTAFNSSQESWRARLLQVAAPVLVALLVLISMIALSGCCAKPLTIIEFQKPTIPPAILLPRRQLTAFSGATCDELAGYTFYAIEEYNNCGADFNALQLMVK